MPECYYLLIYLFNFVFNDIKQNIESRTVIEIQTPPTLIPLRKHAYSNILKILLPKTENFQIKKNSDIFHISAQNIDCTYSLELPRRGGSNGYP